MADKRIRKKTSKLSAAIDQERQPATLQSWRKLYKNRKWEGLYSITDGSFGVCGLSTRYGNCTYEGEYNVTVNYYSVHTMYVGWLVVYIVGDSHDLMFITTHSVNFAAQGSVYRIKALILLCTSSRSFISEAQGPVWEWGANNCWHPEGGAWWGLHRTSQGNGGLLQRQRRTIQGNCPWEPTLSGLRFCSGMSPTRACLFAKNFNMRDLQHLFLDFQKLKRKANTCADESHEASPYIPYVCSCTCRPYPKKLLLWRWQFFLVFPITEITHSQITKMIHCVVDFINSWRLAYWWENCRLHTNNFWEWCLCLLLRKIFIQTVLTMIATNFIRQIVLYFLIGGI